MPIHNLGNGCYRWGDHGHKYCGPGAREKAIKQMRGAFYNGYKGDASIYEESVASELTNVELDEFIGDSNIPYMTRAEFAEAKKKISIPKDKKTGKSQLPNAAGPY